MSATKLEALDQVWFTRCPVPTATGIAADLGWLDDEFAPDGISVTSLQDVSREEARDHHFTHGLRALFREGGNVPALWARSRGAATRLIGLTWVDERQAIVTRESFGLATPQDMRGAKLALPQRGGLGVDFWRAMALHGFAGALGTAGLTLDDVRLVEVPGDSVQQVVAGNGLASQWDAELAALQRGDVDAVYVKGAVGVEAAANFGASVLVDLDAHDDKRFRVNNGTPRPITVDQEILDERPDIVARFLAVLLRASDWAAVNRSDVARILEAETGAGARGVAGAYRNDFHRTLHPDLSTERLTLLGAQAAFLWEHGFLDEAVDVEAWADPAPLAVAHDLLLARAASVLSITEQELTR